MVKPANNKRTNCCVPPMNIMNFKNCKYPNSIDHEFIPAIKSLKIS